MKNNPVSSASVTSAGVPPLATGSEIRWVIVGKSGLYTGQWITRKDAIRNHVNALMIIPSPNYPTESFAWRVCRARGDRAAKARIIFPNT